MSKCMDRARTLIKIIPILTTLIKTKDKLKDYTLHHSEQCSGSGIFDQT